MTTERDISFLRMAYALAEKARGWTSPNPYVGAVIVRGDRIIGTGYHEKPGKPHAEIVALRQAGVEARGATAYITLEPCVHWGRTPPCVDSLLQAGLRRVVVSALDPNPLVYGKGIQKLKQAGVEVSLGLLREKNARLNEFYATFIQKKIPWVTVKAAASMDGKIATRTGESKWITSSRTREYAHLLRGEHDAIMVGIRTILADDPLLTVRHPLWKGKPIARIILDSSLRLPLEARILTSLSRGKILVFTALPSSSPKAAALRERGVEVVSFPRRPPRGPIDLGKVLSYLGRKGIASLLVEGGGRLITSFLEKKLAHKIFLTLSPRLIGGKEAPSWFSGKGTAELSRSLRLKKPRVFSMGGEIVVEGYL